MSETNRSWPRRVLERCAIASLGLMVFAKGSLIFFAAVWLVANVFGSGDLAWLIENLAAGFAGIALGLYLMFVWFLPDDSLARERAHVERVERYSALIRAMEQSEHWSDGSQNVLTGDRSALLASLRAEGFHPGRVMTMANFLARKAVEKELKNHGFEPHRIERRHITAAARAMLAARLDALIEEAKARLDPR